MPHEQDSLSPVGMQPICDGVSSIEITPQRVIATGDVFPLFRFLPDFVRDVHHSGGVLFHWHCEGTKQTEQRMGHCGLVGGITRVGNIQLKIKGTLPYES